jgi:hypothetical protein
MTPNLGHDLETDSRFPTGEWTGFWLQKTVYAGRQTMELSLVFTLGKIRGDGRDSVGTFTMTGRYDTTTGKVTIHKQYAGAHLVVYEGWAEADKGIWGVWTIPAVGKDGFHLWPKGMGDPTTHQKAAAEAPAYRDETPVLVESAADAAE